MKLFVDDIRNAPDETYTVCRTVLEASRAIYQFSSQITEISLDHDISHYENLDETDIDQEVYACAETFWPIAMIIGLTKNYLSGMDIEWNPKVVIHTANPSGAESMADCLDEYGLEFTIEPKGKVINGGTRN